MKSDCNQCDYRTTHQKYFTIHIKSVCEEVKSDCNQCDYKTTCQKYFSIHIKSVHEEVKSDCNQCDYRTTCQGYLTIHINIVNEEVKSDCNQCDYQTTHQGYLTIHIKSVHNGFILYWTYCLHYYPLRLGSLKPNPLACILLLYNLSSGNWKICYEKYSLMLEGL